MWVNGLDGGDTVAVTAGRDRQRRGRGACWWWWLVESGHWLAGKQQQRRRITAECGDFAGGDRGHDCGRGWFQNVDLGEGKLRGLSDRPVVARRHRKTARKGGDGGGKSTVKTSSPTATAVVPVAIVGTDG